MLTSALSIQHFTEISTATFILTFQENARVSPKIKTFTAALGVLKLLDEILNHKSNLLTRVQKPRTEEIKFAPWWRNCKILLSANESRVLQMHSQFTAVKITLASLNYKLISGKNIKINKDLYFYLFYFLPFFPLLLL